MIPTKIYKAIYDPSSGFAGAYIVDNVEGNNYKVISISELERLTGVSLFPKLSKSSKDNAMKLPEPSGSNNKRAKGIDAPVPILYKAPQAVSTAPMSQECRGKRTCKEMSSCEEAIFYLNNCGVTKIDGDGDGMPCEKLCRGK